SGRGTAELQDATRNADRVCGRRRSEGGEDPGACAGCLFLFTRTVVAHSKESDSRSRFAARYTGEGDDGTLPFAFHVPETGRATGYCAWGGGSSPRLYGGAGRDAGRSRDRRKSRLPTGRDGVVCT